MIVRAAILFAASLVAAALAGGCATAVSMPDGMIRSAELPANLYCVDHPACTIYRSAQPTAAEFSALVARVGLRSDLKLNTAIEGRDRLPGGVSEYDHPWSPVGPVDHEDIAAALWDIEQAPKPLLIHCTHGIDRTGLLIAIWRVKAQHTLPSSAWAEWRAFPRESTDRLALYADFERETGYHVPEDER